MNLELFKQDKNKRNIIILLLIFFLAVLAIFFLDKGLSIAFILLVILSAITLFTLYKLGFKDKRIYALFLIAIAVHLGVTLVMHYTNFQPFSDGKGDYLYYQKSAVEFSQNFRHGDFSLDSTALDSPGLYAGHYYPDIIGAVYALTLPKEIIGLMINVWLAALSIVLVYLIVLEIGGAPTAAFIVGLLTVIYPSYLFNSSLLLKDAFEIFFTILSLLFLIKTVKKFSWYHFIVLYLAILCSTHFRFYIGDALIVTFILSWFLFSNMPWKKRILCGMIFIIILGFIPQVAANQGYYGISPLKTLTSPTMISFYRHSAYNPASTYNNPVKTNLAQTSPAKSNTVLVVPKQIIGLGSSFFVENGPVGYIKSFIYVLLGPLPWQIKNVRESLALFETIPWYLLLFFVVDGIIICFKKRNKEAISLLMFSIIVMTVIAIFDSNFGLILRIRISAFISLACIASFGFNDNNIVYYYLHKSYEKISDYWRSWIYRLKHS